MAFTKNLGNPKAFHFPRGIAPQLATLRAQLPHIDISLECTTRHDHRLSDRRIWYIRARPLWISGPWEQRHIFGSYTAAELPQLATELPVIAHDIRRMAERELASATAFAA
jgi:hypothetical protein